MSISCQNIKGILPTLKESTSYNTALDNFTKLIDCIDVNELRDKPKILFDLHKILCNRVDLPDVGIKFTVQTNLFYGSAFQFGRDHHKVILDAAADDKKF
jgi:hypothetical protein